MIHQCYFKVSQRARLFSSPLYREFGLNAAVNPTIAQNCPELEDPAKQTQLCEYGAMLHLWRNPEADPDPWIGFSSYRQLDKFPTVLSDRGAVEADLAECDILGWGFYAFVEAASGRPISLAEQGERCHPGITSALWQLLLLRNEPLLPSYSADHTGLFGNYWVMSKANFDEYMRWSWPLVHWRLEHPDSFTQADPRSLSYLAERLFICWYGLRQKWLRNLGPTVREVYAAPDCPVEPLDEAPPVLAPPEGQTTADPEPVRDPAHAPAPHPDQRAAGPVIPTDPEAVVGAWYRRFLGRDPDGEALAHDTDDLRRGQPPQAVLAALLAGEEYYQRCGATAIRFLHALLVDLNDGDHEIPTWARQPSLTDRRAVAFALLRCYPPTDLALPSERASALRTPSATADGARAGRSGDPAAVVGDWYRRFLGRDPDPRGLADYTDDLRQGAPPQAVLVEILASDEYYQRCGATTDEYLRCLLVDLAHREGAVPSRMSPISPADRREVALGFLECFPSAVTRASADRFERSARKGRGPFRQGSPPLSGRTLLPKAALPGRPDGRTDPAAVVRGWYRHFLGRDPDPQCLAEYAEELRNGLSPRVALAYLLGSEEYYQRCGATADRFLRTLFGDLDLPEREVPGWVCHTSPADRHAVALLVLQRYPPPDLSSPAEHEATAGSDGRANAPDRRATAAAQAGDPAAMVRDWYRRVLVRAADPVGLAAYTEKLRNGQPPEALLAEILASDEYYQRCGATADRFIRALFADLSGRERAFPDWVRQTSPEDRQGVAFVLLGEALATGAAAADRWTPGLRRSRGVVWFDRLRLWVGLPVLYSVLWLLARLWPWLRRLRRRRTPRPLTWGPGLSVVIPERGSPALLAGCLTSVAEAADRVDEAVEVIVVVNGSPPSDYGELAGRFPQVRWLHVPQPLGFATAVRRGVQVARYDAVYLLNNDVRLDREALREVLRWRAPHVFAVGSQLFASDDRYLEEETGWLDVSLIKGWVRSRDVLPEDQETVRGNGYATGGAALFHRGLLGRLLPRRDPYHPFYWEDAEWGVRAWRLGFEVLFCPASKAWHQNHATVERFYPPTEVDRIYRRNALQFTLRNWPTAVSPTELTRRVRQMDPQSRRELSGWRNSFRVLREGIWTARLPYLALDLASVRRKFYPRPWGEQPTVPCVVVVAPGTLYPPRGGGCRRILALVRELAKAFRVVLISDEEEAYGAETRRQLARLAAVHIRGAAGRLPWPKHLPVRTAAIRYVCGPVLKQELARVIDLYRPISVQVEGMESGALVDIGRRQVGWLLDLHDVWLTDPRSPASTDTYKDPWSYEAGDASSAPGGARSAEADRYERRLMKRFDVVLTCSPEDAELIPEVSTQVVPNGAEVHPNQYVSSRSSRLVLFTGSYEHPPGMDGFRAFLREVYPSLRDRVPGLRLVVVAGRSPPDLAGEIAAWRGLGMEVRDCYEDVAGWLARCAVTINPMPDVRGSCIKVAEAVAAGRVCVSSRDGARGWLDAGFPGLIVVPRIADFGPVLERLLLDEEYRLGLERPPAELLDRCSWEYAGRLLSEAHQAAARSVGALPPAAPVREAHRRPHSEGTPVKETSP